jgi:hypothetical protein
VRYATREARRDKRFYGHDPHDGPMSIDYFVWAAVSPDRTVVVDTGFTTEVAVRRARIGPACALQEVREGRVKAVAALVGAQASSPDRDDILPAERALPSQESSRIYSSPRSRSMYCCMASSIRSPVTRKTVLPPMSTPWSAMRSR